MNNEQMLAMIFGIAVGATNGERYYVLYGVMRYAGLRVRRKYFHTYGEAYEFKKNNEEIVI